MLKVFIDGNHFQDQLRNLEIKEGHEFRIKLVKIDHDKLGKWDIYFESIVPLDRAELKEEIAKRFSFARRKKEAPLDRDDYQFANWLLELRPTEEEIRASERERIGDMVLLLAQASADFPSFHTAMVAWAKEALKQQI